MSLPKNRKIEHKHIESMKMAVRESGIQAIHPERMEEFDEYLVQKARTQE